MRLTGAYDIGQSGQASVEFVAVLPLLLAAGAIAWQLALAGHTAWMSAHAARAGARADAVGWDARVAAASALPGGTPARAARTPSAWRGCPGARQGAGAAAPLAIAGVRGRHRVAGQEARGEEALRAGPGHRRAPRHAAGADRRRAARAPVAGRRLLRPSWPAAAAEAGALALAGGADPRAGVRESLPGWSRARARVEVSGGTVRVRLRPPSPLAAVARRFEVQAAPPWSCEAGGP